MILYILGTGEAALNIVEYIEDINNVTPTWNIVWLLDVNSSYIAKTLAAANILNLLIIIPQCKIFLFNRCCNFCYYA